MGPQFATHLMNIHEVGHCDPMASCSRCLRHRTAYEFASCKLRVAWTRTLQLANSSVATSGPLSFSTSPLPPGAICDILVLPGPQQRPKTLTARFAASKACWRSFGGKTLLHDSPRREGSVLQRGSL
ncbi:hypothetical protein NDU88_001758 [Pleurodeles waltl]|uniref:Uncharacterized protein n=1 Tax=Pleurodeles waltl TaxID=8319 RepID=A0AAV7KSS7_PLEWA|nr:hypothetical protein NDU88_001758 [Pleurodeles waltl]